MRLVALVVELRRFELLEVFKTSELEAIELSSSFSSGWESSLVESSSEPGQPALAVRYSQPSSYTPMFPLIVQNIAALRAAVIFCYYAAATQASYNYGARLLH
jgi:hypothetical protein